MDFASIPKPGKHLKPASAKVLVRIKALVADLGEGYEAYFGFIQIDVGLGNGRTRKDPAYLTTRDGLALLVMGLTGGKGLRFQGGLHRSLQRHGRPRHEPARWPELPLHRKKP